MSSFYDNLLHYSSYVQPPVLVRALLYSALHGASCPQEVAFFMIPERSEESLIHSGAKRRTLPNQSQRSFAVAQDDKPLSGLDQTAFSEITEIATR